MIKGYWQECFIAALSGAASRVGHTPEMVVEDAAKTADLASEELKRRDGLWHDDVSGGLENERRAADAESESVANARL